MTSTRMPVQPLPGYICDLPLSNGSGCTVLTRCLQSVCLQLTVAFPNTSNSRVHCCIYTENQTSQPDVIKGLGCQLKRLVKMCMVEMKWRFKTAYSNNLLAYINMLATDVTWSIFIIYIKKAWYSQVWYIALPINCIFNNCSW